MTELPQTENGVAQWCQDIFQEKDALLDKYLSEGTFGNDAFKTIGRPVKSLLVVISWTCLLLFAAFEFFKRASFLWTWEGVVFMGLSLLVVTIIMQVFIQFSQSEHSTPAKLASSKPKNE